MPMSHNNIKSIDVSCYKIDDLSFLQGFFHLSQKVQYAMKKKY